MKSLFIAATGQNVGKTTTCLGLFSLLQKHFGSTGFIKPVGQEHVEIETGVRVDKDVVLFKEYFQIQDSCQSMSPVLFPRGFTRDFLDQKVHTDDLKKAIEKGYQAISSRHQCTLIEGTGHIGVGSIVNLSNAHVAALLKAPLVIVASGGLGSCIDELFLNIIACKKYGVALKGVILNRVLEEKREMIIHYVQKALHMHFNVPLIGAIPYNAFLSAPTMSDFEALFETKLLTGKEFALCHFEHIRIAATTMELYQTSIRENQLIITPAGREDIILSTLTKFWDLKIVHPKKNPGLGMILTGKTAPKSSLVEQIRKANIPMLYIPLSSFIVMKMINTFTLKFRKDDRIKIEQAVEVVESHIDFRMLEKALQP